MAVIADFISGQFQSDETEEIGIGGFVTAARLRERITRTRQVPTTYLEDGTAVSDHIIRDPLIISIEGEVSDVFVKPDPVLQAQRELETQIGAVAQYAPARTQAQLSKISGLVNDVRSQINRADQLIKTAQNFADYLGLTNSNAKSNTELFVDFIDGAYASDALIRIDAPYRTYQNMAITSFTHERDNTTNSLRFTIEAKELRFSDVTFVAVAAAPAPANGTNGQTEGETDKGVQSGVEVEQSFAASLLGRFGA